MPHVFLSYLAIVRSLLHFAKCAILYQVVTRAKEEIWPEPQEVGLWCNLLLQKVRGGGPVSQKLPGSINILAVAQGRLHFLAFAPQPEFQV